VWNGMQKMQKEWRTYQITAKDLDLASTYVLHLFVHYLSIFWRCRDVIVETGIISVNLVKAG
jgi:hypothetical protein